MLNAHIIKLRENSIPAWEDWSGDESKLSDSQPKMHKYGYGTTGRYKIRWYDNFLKNRIRCSGNVYINYLLNMFY